MNQNNNYNFNPTTGQPVMEQPLQNNTPNKKNNSKIIIIVIGLIIVGVIFYFVMNNKKSEDNKTATSNEETKENVSNNSSSNINTNTTYNENGPFLMSIDDTFSIINKGTVVTGTISRGKIKAGDSIQIIGLDKVTKTTTVGEITIGKEVLEEAKAGSQIAVQINGVAREEITRGQVLAAPNSISAVKEFEANVSILSTEDGGRHTPFFTGYHPKFVFKNVDIDGSIELLNGVEMVKPGESANVKVKLSNSMAMEIGTEFSLKENDKIVGSGKVTKIG